MTTPALPLALAAMTDAIERFVRLVAADERSRHVCSGDANHLLTVQAACSRAGISRSTLYAWIKDGLAVSGLQDRLAVADNVRDGTMTDTTGRMGDGAA